LLPFAAPVSEVRELVKRAFEAPGPLYNAERRDIITRWLENFANNLDAAAAALRTGRDVNGRPMTRAGLAAAVEQMCSEYTRGVSRLEEVCGRAVRERFERILANVRSSITCWFCERRPPEAAAAVDVKMFGEVSRTPHPDLPSTRVQWQTVSLKVPRCAPCKAGHDLHENFKGIGVIVGGVPTLLVGLYFFITGFPDFWESLPTDMLLRVPLFMVFVFVGLLILVPVMAGIPACVTGLVGYLIGLPILWRRRIKPVSTRKKFPAVLSRKAMGWRIGEKPPDA
jgi:hypothetical protein